MHRVPRSVLVAVRATSERRAGLCGGSARVRQGRTGIPDVGRLGS
jgi:hypothetical protein